MEGNTRAVRFANGGTSMESSTEKNTEHASPCGQIGSSLGPEVFVGTKTSQHHDERFCTP
ncbi:hypothetical protein PG993_013123 [Apiospora rasikravindrae]|uniref:Uncharacterized protein n=1 Tax=Apiospora rasikravindrae TaxID=990691 RepID=A0ABR1RYB6_9PEZI